MSNLLPLETKKEILKERHFRTVVIALFLLSALLVLSAVWLTPAYILSKNKYDITERELNAIKKEISTVQPEDTGVLIEDINNKLAILGGGISPKHHAYNIIGDIVEQKNNKIKITDIFYDKSGTEIRVLLRGEAFNRESLSSFVREIEKNELFSRVELPISDFVKETDLDFSLTMYIIYEQTEEEEAEEK